MKRIAWLVVSSFGVLALANTPLACVSNTASSPADNDSGAPAQGDAAPQPGTDATVPPSDDGGVPDAAPGVDAGPQPLTLTVLRAGAPESGINVVFQDDTGVALSTSVTGANGSVSQLVTAGSQVTVVLGTAQDPNLVTIQGVAPGDQLTVTDTQSTSTVEDDVTTTLPPSSTWDASAVTEEVNAGTCSNPVAYPIYLGSECQSGGYFPLFARAVDNSTGDELAYTFQTGTAVVPDGGFPDGDTGLLSVTVNRPWSTSTATETIAGTNAPPLPVDAGPGGAEGNVEEAYMEVSGGVAMSLAGSNATTDDGGASATFIVHPGYPDFVQAEAYDQVSSDYDNVFSFVGGATRSASPTTSQSVSFDLSTLPLITGTSVNANDAGTTTQPTITWTTGPGSLAAANGIFLSAQWYATIVTEGGETNQNGTWTFYAPPTATSVQAPVLPTPLAAWAPAPTTSWDFLPRMAVVQASFLSGYAGFRSQAATLPLLSGYTIVIPTLPVNGTAYISGIYPDEG